MRWNSIEELVKDFNLNINPSDEASVKSEIRKQLSIIHPDKNNGQFSSDNARKRFDLLTQALEFLEESKKESQALTSTNSPSAIIEVISSAIALTKEEKLNRELNECRSMHKSAMRSRYFYPRLKSGFFAGLCGLLIAFAEQLKTHPLFKPFLITGADLGYNPSQEKLYLQAEKRLSLVLPFLLLLFFYAGTFFLLTWFNEQKDEAKGEWLLSEEGLRHILRNVLQKGSGTQDGTNIVSFTKRDVESVIKELYKSKKGCRLPFQRYSGISSSLVEKIAKLHLEELNNRGVVKRTEGAKLDVTYEMKREIANELKEESPAAKA